MVLFSCCKGTAFSWHCKAIGTKRSREMFGVGRNLLSCSRLRYLSARHFVTLCPPLRHPRSVTLPPSKRHIACRTKWRNTWQRRKIILHTHAYPARAGECSCIPTGGDCLSLKKNKNPCKTETYRDFLRRERDSNSRTSFAGHTLSRRASSATRASLLSDQKRAV